MYPTLWFPAFCAYNEVMRQTAWPCAVCLLFFAVWLPLPAAPQPPAEESPAVIRTGVAEVLLEVVVRDRRGRLVRNLKPEDLEIYENGVKQDIRAFRLAGTDRRRTERTAQTAAPAAPAAAASRPMPLRAVNLLCIVFHNLDPVNRTRALRMAETILKEEFPPNTLAAIFALDDYLTPVSPFTDQKQDLLAAVQQAFSGRSLDFFDASVSVLTANPTLHTIDVLIDVAGRSATVTDRVAGGEVSKTIVPRADVSMSASANATRGFRARERVDMAHVTGSRAFDQIDTMVSQLSQLPGRKSVILISGGLLTTGDPDAFGKLMAKANAANMTVYSFDPTELDEVADTQAAKTALAQVAEVSRSQTQLNPNISLSERRQQSRQGDALEVAVRSSDLRAALRELAEGTGGFLVANTSEFNKPFRRVLEEMEARYEVAYRPADLKLDGRLRTIEVKTTRKDLVVESRTAYFALPAKPGGDALAAHEVIGLALLGKEPRPADFDFHYGLYTFGAPKGQRDVALAFELPGKDLTAAQDAARGVARAHVSIVGLVKDASGEVVERFSIDSPYEFSLVNLPAMQASRITHAQTLRLAPGHYTVEAVLLDRTGGRSSAKTLEIEVPPAASSLAISTPMLVQRVEESAAADGDPLVYQGRRVVPMVAAALDAVSQPHVYFVVYPDKNRPEKPQLLVEFFVNGQKLAAQTAELPPPDAAGAVPMMVSAAMRPGLCELRFTATQGEAKAAGSVRYVVPQLKAQTP